MFKKPVLIAEIGGNHQGDFGKAIELVDMALECRVDMVKLQTYFADTLVEKSYSPERWSHFKKFELTIEQHVQLAERITKAGKQYLSSIWDAESYRHLEEYLKYVKIGSGDAVCQTFLERAAKTSKPIILSTGLCDLEEVSSSIDILRSTNSFYEKRENIYLLQCTAMYPIPLEESNLAIMSKYREFGCMVGYSDHTVGNFALEVASVMGADMLEFHFTDDKENETFRDHRVSLDAADVETLVDYLGDVTTVVGSNVKEPTSSEMENGHVASFRRGAYLNKNLVNGSVIKASDLIEKRPMNDGLTYSELIGKKLSKDLKKGDAVEQDNIHA